MSQGQRAPRPRLDQSASRIFKFESRAKIRLYYGGGRVGRVASGFTSDWLREKKKHEKKVKESNHFFGKARKNNREKIYEKIKEGVNHMLET